MDMTLRLVIFQNTVNKIANLHLFQTYKLSNYSNFNTHYLSWNYQSFWHKCNATVG